MQTDCGMGCVDLRTTTYDCGACGHVCQPGIPCTGGACMCPAPTIDCPSGCADTTRDAANCGACGRSCGPGGACSSGTCTCGPGYTMCGASCVLLSGDHANCGTCGHACMASEACIGATCQPHPLYHGLTAPMAGCLTSSYDSTAPTAMGGSYPYNASDSPACRAWKLAATVCSVPPMPYGAMPPGDWMCPMAGGFTDAAFGTYCAVPMQFACSDCYGACNAMCNYRPLSLRNCGGMETAQQ